MTDVNNFTQSLIEMAEAVRVKPELEAKIAALTEDNRLASSTNEILRARCDEAANTVSNLTAKLSEVTKERDDAMFRNLELDEKLDQFASMAGKVLGMVKPTPEKVPEPIVEPAPIVVQPEPFTHYGSPVATQYDTTTGQTEPVSPTYHELVPDVYNEERGPTQDEIEPPALIHTNWEHGKPYSYKPWYMQDSEWTSLGGLPKPTDEPVKDVMNF